MDKDKKIPQYQTDEITVQLIETVLNIAAQAAQLQITEESAESIFALTESLAAPTMSELLNEDCKFPFLFCNCL